MRLGLRGQILVALLLVTVGAIASIVAIVVWQTRQALAGERVEQAAALTGTARAILEVALDGSRPLSDEVNRTRARTLAPELARAVGADELAFFDERGASLHPTDAPLALDEEGVAAALAGASPHAEERPRAPGDPAGVRLVAYAPLLSGGRTAGVVRATFALDAAVDATLGRARTAVLLLGAVDALVLLVVAAWILRGAVLRPVRELERAARRVAEGDLEAKIEVRGPGELALLADAFDRMTRSLRAGRDTLIRSEKLASVGRLAAGVAHEVGNPLAAILGYVEMLAGETPERPLEPALRKDMLDRVRGETERIHRIIQELLEFARPPKDEPAAVDVRRACEAAVSLVHAQKRHRGVALDVTVPEGLPPARASAGGLTQVLLNLLMNAADAAGPEGSVTVDARTDGDQVVLAVSDDGPGIPAELRAQIFDPFFTTKEPGQGTGLGLSVSLAIVESYGGALRLASSDKGARFEVVLPAA